MCGHRPWDRSGNATGGVFCWYALLCIGGIGADSPVPCGGAWLASATIGQAAHNFE